MRRGGDDVFGRRTGTLTRGTDFALDDPGETASAPPVLDVLDDGSTCTALRLGFAPRDEGMEKIRAEDLSCPGNKSKS